MPPQKQSLAVPIAIVIAGALIGFAIYMTGKPVAPEGGSNKQPTNTVSMAPISGDDHILGNPKAELIIVEYSDTECPFCKRFHQTLQQVMNTYGKDGRVAWVYRHFPIDSLHKKARKEAEATECAAELGGNTAFWKYIDRLYEITPSNDGLDLTQLPVIAEYAGLDRKAFESCLASGRHSAKVQAQYEDGVKAGARGTPYSVFVVGDEKIPVPGGALPYDQIRQIIESILR